MKESKENKLIVLNIIALIFVLLTMLAIFSKPSSLGGILFRPIAFLVLAGFASTFDLNNNTLITILMTIIYTVPQFILSLLAFIIMVKNKSISEKQKRVCILMNIIVLISIFVFIIKIQ